MEEQEKFVFISKQECEELLKILNKYHQILNNAYERMMKLNSSQTLELVSICTELCSTKKLINCLENK